MKKVFFGLLIGFFFLMGFASAVNDASVRVHVSQFGNYTPPGSSNPSDMSDYIYVGSNQPLGQGDVEIPLIQNGAIIEDVPMNGDVPGLYVERGIDNNGAYVKFLAYGSNDHDSREAIRFSLDFSGAKILGFSTNDFEYAEDGICDVVPGGNIINFRNDEYTFDIPGNSAEICSTTNAGDDTITLYYALFGNGQILIDNVEVSPDLPLRDRGNGQIFSINFDSNYYPIYVGFELEDSVGNIVDRQSSVTIASSEDLPVQYGLTRDIENGDYELYMNIENVLGDSVRIDLGQIMVRRESSSDDDKNPRVVISQNFNLDENQENSQIVSGLTLGYNETSTDLTQDKISLSGLQLLNIVLLIALALLLVLILVVLILR